jgi:hypothetical protein
MTIVQAIAEGLAIDQRVWQAGYYDGVRGLSMMCPDDKTKSLDYFAGYAAGKGFKPRRAGA